MDIDILHKESSLRRPSPSCAPQWTSDRRGSGRSISGERGRQSTAVALTDWSGQLATDELCRRPGAAARPGSQSSLRPLPPQSNAEPGIDSTVGQLGTETHHLIVMSGTGGTSPSKVAGRPGLIPCGGARWHSASSRPRVYRRVAGGGRLAALAAAVGRRLRRSLVELGRRRCGGRRRCRRRARSDEARGLTGTQQRWPSSQVSLKAEGSPE